MSRHAGPVRQAKVHDADVSRAVPARAAVEATVAPSPEQDDLLGLQRSVGNRAVTTLLQQAQASLKVGRADDPYEVEADAVARQVVASLSQPASADAGTFQPEEEEGIARTIRRRTEPGTGPMGPEGGPVDAGLEQELQSARSGGSPLPSSTRSQMEGAFGADFGSVRVHEGAGSSDLNRQFGASAFTVGRDIFFGDSTPSLSGSEGQHLLAHELTHVVQQGAAHPFDQSQRG